MAETLPFLPNERLERSISRILVVKIIPDFDLADQYEVARHFDRVYNAIGEMIVAAYVLESSACRSLTSGKLA